MALTAAELQALLDGRIAAIDVNAEYLINLSVDAEAADEVRGHVKTPEWIIELASREIERP